MRNVITCGQYTRESLEALYTLTDKIVKKPNDYANMLEGKTVAVFFYEPSSRTRLSFQAAIQKVGAKMLVTENAQQNSSMRKGESLLDTIRSIQEFCDAIILRHPDNDSSSKALTVAKVPIINAGAGSGEHPTQALLDIYTIRENRGSIDGIKVAVLGDLLYGRTIHSLLRLLSLYDNITVYGLSKKEFALPQKYIDLLTERNIPYNICSGFDDIPKDVDVLYHTRIQSERFSGDYGKETFIIDQNVFNQFSDNTILLHPLPRNNEISMEVDHDPRALYFRQARNGLFVRMALLLLALEAAES